MFRSQIPRSLDAKGRLMLTPEYRDALMEKSADGRLALAIYDGCISGYALPDWEKLEAKILSLKATSRKVRDLQRLLIGGVDLVTIDKQGRIQLSQRHRKYAGLTKEVLLVGMGEKFEIWDNELLDDRTGPEHLNDEMFEDLAEQGINLFSH